MAVEIERKFLVNGDGWRGPTGGTVLSQGYLSLDPTRAVRIRLAGSLAWINIKAARDSLSVRDEFEYEIPAKDARALLALCLPGVISKTRHHVPHGSHTWEVDVFHDENDGLVVAEVELQRIDEPLLLPDWVGAEVSEDPRYTNVALCEHPYRTWRNDG